MDQHARAWAACSCWPCCCWWSFPLAFDIFRLNLVGKYLSYGFVALGLVMLWGYGGVLSLGQGVFFGLGGYAMAMFLKLEASDPITTKIQSTPGIPDFMDWNQLTALPLWWQPFEHLPVRAVRGDRRAHAAGLHHRLRHVQAARGRRVLRHHHAGGGADPDGAHHRPAGLHRRRQRHDRPQDRAGLGHPHRQRQVHPLLPVHRACCWAASLLCLWIQKSKLGTLLLAMRDKEDRVRFSGYDVAMFKVFVFCLAAALSGIGGALFTLQVGFMSPSFVGIVPSIEMVIYAAVGGRMSLVGAVYGTLLVNFGKTYFSESFPDLWLFLMAALFIGVTMAFPDGLAGVWETEGQALVETQAGRAPGHPRAVHADAASDAPGAQPATSGRTPPLPGGVSGQSA